MAKKESIELVDPTTGELVPCAPEDRPLALIGQARQLLAQATTFVDAMKAETLAKLAKQFAKLMNAGVATGNEALLVEWAARIRILQEYQLARARGEVAGEGGDKRSITVQGSDSGPPTTNQIEGLDRRRLSETGKVVRVGGLEFTEALLRQATETNVEGTTAFILRAAAGILNLQEVADIADGDAELPEGKFECIVIDPPWPMKKIDREVRPHQAGFAYPTMTEEELAEFPLPEMAADDCHLFLWTTQKFLPMAFRLAEDAWGFRYVCTFVWHKAGGFQPIGLPQYNCEFAIYCRKGTPKFIDTKAFPTCFEAGRREHSRKPDEFYDMVQRVTAGPRIEVFAREPRDGFELFGNETAKFEAVA